MPQYKPIKARKEDKHIFVCRCGNKINLQISGNYESATIECVKCMNEITLTREEIEKCPS